MKIFQILFFSLLSFSSLISQADLIVSDVSVSSTILDKGDYLVINAIVQNIGNTTASATNVTFHLTTDDQVDDNDMIGEVLIPSLSVNQFDTINFIYSVPFDFLSSNYFAAVWIDQGNIVIESDEQNAVCLSNEQGCEIIVVTGSVNSNNKLPYPIIFIHGLESDSDKWYDYLINVISEYKLVFGGDLKYCLNPDNDVSTSDFDQVLLDFTNQSILGSGDVYTINFNVDIFGNINDDNGLSNQSAIFKQGVAVQKAIKKILELTGKDKVVLVGHSMGGLASRQYLQLREWQDDNDHHVAKLFTIDTPHGGSNAATISINGIDINSEAVRDLKYDNFEFGHVGTYIDGGLENLVLDPHYNLDVNINGIESDFVTGINQRSFPEDIDYACSIANFNDYIIFDFVKESSANINNHIVYEPPFLPKDKPVFYIDGNHSTITDDFYGITQGLDESQDINIPYHLDLDVLYLGLTTFQNSEFTSQNDIDYYEIEIEDNGILEIIVSNVTSPVFNLSILNENQNIVFNSRNVNHSLFETINVEAGTYYLKVDAIPVNKDHHYYIGAVHTPISPVSALFEANSNIICVNDEVSFTNLSDGNPTNFAWNFEGGFPNVSLEESPTVEYRTPGKYDVTLTVNNSNSINTLVLEDYIIVEEFPDIDFGISYLDEGLVSFPVLSNHYDPNTIFNWDFGDGESLELQGSSPIHEYENSGTYNVALTVENICGTNTVIKEVIVNVSQPISANFESNIISGCSPVSVEYRNSSLGNSTDWEWVFEGGNPATSTDENPIVTYNNEGKFDVSLKVSNNLFSDESLKEDYFTAFNTPVANFNISSINNYEYEFNNLTSNENGESFFWDFGDGNISSEESPTHKYISTGEFQIILSVTNECGTSTSIDLITIVATSTIESNIHNSTSLIPNPNSGLFEINFRSNIYKNINVEIYNSSGEKVDFKMMQDDNKLSLSCNSLPSGLYILKLYEKELIKSMKFIISK